MLRQSNRRHFENDRKLKMEGYNNVDKMPSKEAKYELKKRGYLVFVQRCVKRLD
jgi:hypothetical protein